MAMTQAAILARTRKVMEAFQAGHITTEETQIELERLRFEQALNTINEIAKSDPHSALNRGDHEGDSTVGMVHHGSRSDPSGLLGRTERDKALVRSH